MSRYFFNPSENRLRAGWRILLFVPLFMLFASLIFLVRPLLGDVGKKEFLNDYSLLIVLILAFAATLAVYLSRRFLDKKSFPSLGLKRTQRTLPDLLFGFFLSAVMAGMFFGLALLFGLIDYHGLNWNPLPAGTDYVSFISVLSIGSLAIFLVEHILVGYWEELVFRGYLFQNMREGLGLVLAIVVSCLLYGLIHASNPNATVLSSSIIVLFGFLRIYGYLSTKMLWFSMGMHIGWNFFQGPIFGFSASGHQTATLVDLSPTGPDWLSGGAFGPEGSLLIIPILGLALLAMRWWSKKGFAFNRREASLTILSVESGERP